MENIVKINEIGQVTHDVKFFRTEKPSGYTYLPGQATDLSIRKPGLEQETRPFTFTSLVNKPYLEFTIKRYPEHHGITDKLHQLNPGDELIIRDSWGAIEYKEPGYFIAGGAGITPFIAILRSLFQENQITGSSLFFSNKTTEDIIYQDELRGMLGKHAEFILTRESKPGFVNGRIDEVFLLKHVFDFNRHFYVCGPDSMVAEILDDLRKLGAAADSLIFEK